MDWEGYSFDFQHAFVADTPGIFFVEAFGRTVLLFVFALFLVRLLGKRALGQVSPYEFVVLIAMGSALGDPMFYPNVAMLPPMLAMATIVLMQRVVSWATERSERLERFVEGESLECVRDGVVVRGSLHKEVVAPDELMMMLREKGIENLAEVRSAILETSGRLSVFPYRDEDERWGLSLESVLPGSAHQRIAAGDRVGHGGPYACVACGHTRRIAPGHHPRPCPECACEQWLPAAKTASPC
jgi:uncharacterized membrane protein YcaP (DUF421 family)